MPIAHRRSAGLPQAMTCCALLLLGACSNGSNPAGPIADEAPPPPNLCTDPRPEICTREYVGVCAVLTDGSTRTAATGCTACSDPDVVGWLPGECE